MRKEVPFGEVERSSKRTIYGAELRARAATAPFVRGRRVVHALWLRESADGEDVITPERVLEVLR